MRPAADVPKARSEGNESWFRLGLFGDTRSGKTMFLAGLQCAAESGQLASDVGLRAANPKSAQYLGSRVAQLRAGQWPPGTLDAQDVTLLVDKGTKTIAIHAADFKGGDFARAFYDGEIAQTHHFLRRLFNPCHAYLFLVDPGPLKAASLLTATAADQEQRERYIQSLVIAIGKLQSWNPLFHRPVAIAFTKTDQHPDVADDPAGFAARYLNQIENYLRRYAPVHRYFAVSATGSIQFGHNGPCEPLKPRGLLEPIFWCAEHHAGRTRLLKWILGSLAAAALLALYIALYCHNAREITVIRRNLTGDNYADLTELFRETRSFEGWSLYALTHPTERVKIRQDISNAAEMLKQKEWEQRRDPSSKLPKSVDDYEKILAEVLRFEADFGGTENAARLGIEIAMDGHTLADQYLSQLRSAADDGNEKTFEEARKQYIAVATEPDKEELTKYSIALGQKRAENEMRNVWDIRENNKLDRPRILGHCQIGEDIVKKYGVPDTSLVVEYLTVVRRAYERGDGKYRLRLKLSTDKDRHLGWWKLDAGEAGSEEYRQDTAPQPDGDGDYLFTVEALVDPIAINLESTVTVAVENKGFRDHFGSWSGALGALEEDAGEKFDATVRGGTSETYSVAVQDDDHELQAILSDNEKMSDLEKRLFEDKR
jgi:hypothetical protein